MPVESYLAERRKALKRIVRQLRREAGYSQQALAELLGCARARITDIEKIESSSEYNIAEMEILAALCGQYRSNKKTEENGRRRMARKSKAKRLEKELKEAFLLAQMQEKVSV